MRYDNPENLSPLEILSKMNSFGSGVNRNRRTSVLLNYSTEKITLVEWKNKYCK